MDVEFMKLLGTKVNILPVLSKADSLTRDELEYNKKLILQDIDHHSIPVYQFPTDEEDDYADDGRFESDKPPSPLRNALPFAIVGGSKVVTDKRGRQVLVREYPWGVIDVEDPEVSDFPLLRDLLLSTHMSDLKETTFDYLYENYRTDKLSNEIPGESVTATTSDNNGRRIVSAASNADSVASNSFLAREEQLRLEEEKLRSIEQRVQDEIAQKRMELLRREQELKELEARLRREASIADSGASSVKSETTA
ncbi:septin CDC11 [Sugiyamaella lignohabitans]|uniref:Septin CDC11 n=1 Tax=Sugiyamaella lignohabitans TaxID=796027 RepID=A0A167EM49_9ASCO|nr:septin CDC11 [Sugiyamaella lignohabitans]ANB14241.1 septin CDC11 [Sugiyamaella lignohabitans]